MSLFGFVIFVVVSVRRLVDHLPAVVRRPTPRARGQIAASHIGAAVVAAAARFAGRSRRRRRSRDAQMSLVLLLLYCGRRISIVLISQSRSGSGDGLRLELRSQSVKIVVHVVLAAGQMEEAHADAPIE